MDCPIMFNLFPWGLLHSIFFTGFLHLNCWQNNNSKSITIGSNTTRKEKKEQCVFHIHHLYFTTNVRVWQTQTTGLQYKPQISQQRWRSLQDISLFYFIYILMRTTAHNSMQVTTCHYEWHKGHNTCWKDLPWFLETRTHHRKKCSRYTYIREGNNFTWNFIVNINCIWSWDYQHWKQIRVCILY